MHNISIVLFYLCTVYLTVCMFIKWELVVARFVSKSIKFDTLAYISTKYIPTESFHSMYSMQPGRINLTVGQKCTKTKSLALRPEDAFHTAHIDHKPWNPRSFDSRYFGTCSVAPSLIMIVVHRFQIRSTSLMAYQI